MSAGRVGPVLLAGLGSACLCGLTAAAEPTGLCPWPPRWTSASGQLRLELTGHLQLDTRAFDGWSVAGDVDDSLRADEAEVRRARVGLTARWQRLDLELEAELADAEEPLKDAWLGWRFGHGLRLRAGRLKLPFSREWLVGSKRLDFAERSLPVSALAPGRDWGAEALARLGRVEAQAGLFAGDGAADASRAGTTVAGRLAWRVAHDLELAASASGGEVAADLPAVTDPRRLGLAGDSASGYRFFERKFVDGHRRRLGLDARLGLGPVTVTAEVLDLREERRGQGALLDDLPAETARGWSASAVWRVLGRSQPRAQPARTLELGLRLDQLRFDDAGPEAGFAGVGSRARNIRPQSARVLTGGLSWWPRTWLRLLSNLLLERYEDALLAPEPGRAGEYVTLVARLQLALP